MENLDESDQLILGRGFIRNIDVTVDLAMRCSDFESKEGHNKTVKCSNEKKSAKFLE